MSLLAQAIRFEHPETIPVKVSILPAAWFHYGNELLKLTNQYPQFFGDKKFDPDHIRETMAIKYQKGGYTDEWGCIWSNLTDGNGAIVTGHPLESEKDIYSLKIPENRDGRLPHGFMYLRLLDLIGFESAMMLFAEESEALNVLIDKVEEYNSYQIASILSKMPEVQYFGDDLGLQKGLAIGAERWRKYIKPCYRKLYGIIKSYKPDQLIYMHTDGCIHEIMPDLVEVGVDMINPQFRANGLDNLVRVCRKENKIAINLDLDRQLFPFATPSELDDHVKSCVEALYLPEGGLGLNIEFNYEIPLENMAAILDAAEKYRFYKG